VQQKYDRLPRCAGGFVADDVELETGGQLPGFQRLAGDLGADAGGIAEGDDDAGHGEQ